MSKQIPWDTVIVVGATGQTGRRLLEVVHAAKPTVRILATARTVDGMSTSGAQWFPLNLEASDSALTSQVQAICGAATGKCVVFFAAAWTNVEACEENPDQCFLLNRDRTIAAIDAFVRRLSAQPVFYSTDYVFDGTAQTNREEDRKNPLSNYGRAKSEVEDWLRNRHPANGLILRTTGVYDYRPGSKNFLMQMLALWQEGVRTRIPDDQLANPVWALELAQASVELAARGVSGVVHVAGGEMLHRVEFARKIARAFSAHLASGPAPVIEAVRTQDLHQKAKRPLRGGLDCAKLERLLGWRPAGPDPVLANLAKLVEPAS